jgi:hypothetical protein
VVVSGIEDADALPREISSRTFLDPEPAVSVSPCVGRLKVKEWLRERYSEHWAAAPGMRHSKFFIGRPSGELCWDLMVLIGNNVFW